MFPREQSTEDLLDNRFPIDHAPIDEINRILQQENCLLGVEGRGRRRVCHNVSFVANVHPQATEYAKSAILAEV
jgi:hypothetical protein